MARIVLLVTLFVSAALCGQIYFEPSPDGRTAVVRGVDSVPRVDAAGMAFANGMQMRIVNARRSRARFEHPSGGVSHYYTGAQPRLAVPHYARVRYTDVLPGIDLVYYDRNGSLEYDFIVQPGADPRQIALDFQGASDVRLSGGKLVVAKGSEVLVQSAPVSYQSGRTVPARWARKGTTAYPRVQSHDPAQPLIIDPVIESATWFGRTGQDSATAVAVDAAGNTWIAGETNSPDLGTTAAFQGSRSVPTDAYLAKLSSRGSVLAVTYFGGSKSETGLAVAVDSRGNPVLAGVSRSADLRVSSNAAQPQHAGDDLDVFVAKFDAAAATLEWGTYLGGNGTDWLGGIAVSPTGDVWVTGWTTSSNFPVRSAIQGGNAGGGGDAFVTRIASDGRAFTWSSYYGSEAVDQGSGIAIDRDGNVHIAGSTTSDRITLVQPLQRSRAGAEDGFYLKIDPLRNELVAATYLGGRGVDYAIRVATDEAGNAYLFGFTESLDFPVTPGAYQKTFGGNVDVFVARMERDGKTLGYSTYLGGSNRDWAGGLAVDSSGSAFLAGWTNSTNFPLQNAVQSGYQGGTRADAGYDAFAARLNPSGSNLIYATYYGGRGEDRAFGIAVDGNGASVIAGTTSSRELPSAAGSFSAGRLGEEDAFVARLSSDAVASSLSVTPSAVAVNAGAGNAETPPIVLEVRASAGTVPISVSADVPWLRPQSMQATAPASVSITLDAFRLPQGQHTGNITLRSTTETITVPVRVNVSLVPTVSVLDPAVITAGSPAQTVVIRGSGFDASATVEANGRSLRPVVLDSTTMTVAMPEDLLRAEGRIEIVIASAGFRSPAAFLSVASSRPTISERGVVHAATWLPGPVAPGEFVIIAGSGFGTPLLSQSQPAPDGRFPIQVGDLRVWFDEAAAPILWVRSGQVSAQVPHSIRDRAEVSLSVEFRGVRSNPVRLGVNSAVPGLFTAGSTGVGQAAAVNEGGAFNAPTSPARPGSVIVLFATGHGISQPLLAEGTVEAADAPSRPLLPVGVTVGGRAAIVEYAGGVPGSITGLLQVNVRVPEDAPLGDSVPVQLQVGTATSPAVTLSIR